MKQQNIDLRTVDLADNGQFVGSVRLPIRILRSRGTHLAKITLFILAGGLAVVAWMTAISLTRPVASYELSQAAFLFGGVLAVVAFVVFRRQLRYFGPRGRYWLVIERDHVTFVTPGKLETFDWRDLTRFVVDEEIREVMNSGKHVEQNVMIHVVAHDTGPASRTLRIAADDFAEKLPGNRRERAEKFCAILNEMRGRASDATINRDPLSKRTFSGLVVAAQERILPRVPTHSSRIAPHAPAADGARRRANAPLGPR